MTAQTITLENLTENHYLSLPRIGDPANGQVIIQIYEIYRYAGLWYTKAYISYNPAGANVSRQVWYHAESRGLVDIIKMQNAPVTIWFPAGARVLDVIPGMKELYLEAGYHA